MPIAMSPVITSETARHGSFSASRFSLDRFGGLVDPVMGMDHYRMNAVTFAPHPHAGFSAISYLFEDSAGGLRNRDSLGNDFVVEPGGIVWTQAGSGVIHDELPAVVGQQVHGLQIFVNLKAANKERRPEVFLLKAEQVPVWRDGVGNSIRIAVGAYGELSSPIRPAEPFNFYDIEMAPAGEVTLPITGGWNMMIYVTGGSVQVAGDSGRVLNAGDAVGVGVSENTADISILAKKASRIVVLSGAALREPVTQYGPFIMNTPAQIEAAVERYQRGDMGQLPPL